MSPVSKAPRQFPFLLPIQIMYIIGINILYHVRFQVFTAVTTKNAVFWDVARCRHYVNRRFGGTYLHGATSQKTAFFFFMSRWKCYIVVKFDLTMGGLS
jgi:hypothetical protein